eukprot:352020-Chlamydomonas_euryale.AAC.12
MECRHAHYITFPVCIFLSGFPKRWTEVAVHCFRRKKPFSQGTAVHGCSRVYGGGVGADVGAQQRGTPENTQPCKPNWAQKAPSAGRTPRLLEACDRQRRKYY